MTEKTEAKAKGASSRKALCSKCGGNRNCEIHGKVAENYNDQEYESSTIWYLLRCRGCEHIFVQTVSTNSEEMEPLEGPDQEFYVPTEKIEYWPALAKRVRPSWLNEIGIETYDNERLNDALHELYKALDNDLHILAGIGLRTAFDVASESLGIDPELTFQEKLSELVAKRFIGQQDKSQLEVLVAVGNASAHRGWKPRPQQLDTVMEVMEDFLQRLFVIPKQKTSRKEKVSKLKKSIPMRKPRQPRL